jgi:4-aminobutyrate aminotransferase-like enzyme
MVRLCPRRAALRDRGILAGIGGVFSNVLRIQPSVSITSEEREQAAAGLEEVLPRK